MAEVNFKELDENIVGLVKALNSFKGITTTSSCGGHENPVSAAQWPKGSWYVAFVIDRDDHGWFALEFLSWLINHDYQGHVSLWPDAKPPYLNTPGKMLEFIVEGREGENPQAFADWIYKVKDQCYIPPGILTKQL